MNDNRYGPPRRGPYRNQNPPSQSYMQQESHSRFSSQNNLSQMPNPNSDGQNVYSSTQNVSYQQQTNVQVRSFSGGRESDSEPYHSLNQQRVHANQLPRNRNYGPRRNYNNPRGNNRGGKRNYNPNFRRRSQGNGSDNESVSSNESQSQYQVRKDYDDSESLMYRLPNRSMSYDHSEAASNRFPSQSATASYSSVNLTPYPDDINRNKSSWRYEQLGASEDCGYNESRSMNHSMMNSAAYSDKAEHNNSSQSAEKSFGVKNIHDPSVMQKADALTALRNHKEAYENMLRSLEPTDVILDCRSKVDELCKEAITQNFKYILEMKSRLNSNKNCEAFKLHLDNLMQQQRVFEDTIAKVKGQLSQIFVSDIQDLLKSTDAIKVEVKNECRLFKRSLPAYAFKSTILNEVKDNQVTIVSADSTYFLNILLPIFVKNEFKEHCLVCCETSEMLCARLKRNIVHLMYNKENMDEIDEKKLNNSIRFMVVEEILDLFSNDYTVDEKNLFVILNLSLKRSVDLDIVLANLKDMLQNHDEARVVLLTSDCDHPQKYESYFSDQAEVAKISLPNLTLPVKTVWKSLALLPTDDYIDEVVKTALAIHTLNDPGDIIAFLPTQSDAKSASVGLTKKFSAFQFDDFECVILHENSTSKYGLDLFSTKKSSKRTIFLVTDCAEMLVISSVCFVIDCGLKKEYMYDVNKKLDVMTTTFISRDKCKLRKSLAGAFSDGVCYRLYNKENFRKEMPSSEYPELLTVNPFNSMIKVFQHRPCNATTVDFVECLPKATKDNALKLLKKYNAIKDNVLTELGKNIVKLPFPAKYSKLILLGIQWGLAFEAVVLVAFFSVKGRVFEYSADPESQKLIDAVKLQLIQSDSDTLSYLFIYKTWLENNSSLEWCNKHCINSETLKSVNLKVNEICQIVGESLKENISQEFSSAKDNAMSLLELLFECFQENLCVFTGHYKSGYRILSSHCIAFLHPSSIICQMENLPQFIIFDHMIQTARDFLVTITAIPSDFVMQGLKDLSVEFDYSDMFEKSLHQKIIEPVGERMIKQVLLGKKGKKLKVIEDEIKKKLSTTSLVIEPMPEKGRVLVYALEEQCDQAVELVNEILKSQFEEIINSEQTKVLELKRGQIKVPVEVKWIKGANVVSVKTGSSDKTLVTIQNNLDDEEENPSDQPPAIIQQSINLTWTRRRCNGKGFINLKSDDFKQARKLAMKCVPFSSSEVFVQLSKFEQNQLYITGIPPETKNDELEEAFSSLLHGITLEKVELKFTEPFETSQNAIQEMKDTIEEMCRKNTDLVNFNIVIPKPKDTATIMKAYVNVNDDEDIGPAAVALSNFKMGDFKLVSKAVYRSVIKCRVEVCEALKERFFTTLNELQDELRKDYKEAELFEFIINKVSDDMAAIKMLSNRCEILQTLQRSVNVLLEGQVLNKMFNNKLGKIFCHGGHMWLQTLEKSCNVHIVEDYVTKTLRLYGSEDGCYSAKRRIQLFLEDTENEVVKPFPLSVEGNSRKLLKAVIIEYGANLEKFIESCELQSANLDIRSCVLTAHGNRESIEKVSICSLYFFIRNLMYFNN